MQKFPSIEIKKLLVELIKFETVNPPSLTKDIVNYLSEWFRINSISYEIIPFTKNGIELHNIVAKIGTGQKKIILSGHLDVVPPGEKKDWIDADPYSGKELNGNIYGRGSADMKGGVVGILAVLLMLKDEQELLKNYQIIFAGTADEESGMTGALNLRINKIMENAACLIIPEATNLKVGIAEKGLLWIRITIKGKAAHASQPDQGINAIEKASSLYQKIKDLIDKEKYNSELDQTTSNIGIIQGGSKINIVPDSCTIDVDYRIIPEEYDGFKEKVLNKLQSEDVSLEILHELIPVKSDKNDPFIKNLCAESDSKPVGVTYATDGAILVNESISPYPFVIFGPGDPTIIHKVNEHVSFYQIERFSTIISKTILKTFNK